MARKRCKYGSHCYRRSSEHMAEFCHPGDLDWSRGGPMGRLDAPDEYDNVAPATAMYTNEQGEVHGIIEQGPGILRLIAFAAGMAAMVFAVLRLLHFFTIFAPATYILEFYLAFFALTTILFEAKPSWVEAVKPASGYQDMLIKYCPFLTTALGRGFFYIFQGTLWFALDNQNLLEKIAGLAFIFVGAFSVLMHFGVIPDHIVEKAMSPTEGLLK